MTTIKRHSFIYGTVRSDAQRVPVFPANIITYPPSSQYALWMALCGVLLCVHMRPTVARVTPVGCSITGVTPSILLQFLFDEIFVVARHFCKSVFCRLWLQYNYPAGSFERNIKCIGGNEKAF